MQNLTNEQLLRLIERIGKEMTSASTTRHNAMEKERMILMKEAFKRGLKGYKLKKKYWNF